MTEWLLVGGPMDGEHLALGEGKRDLWIMKPSAPLYGVRNPSMGTEVIQTTKGLYEAPEGSEGTMLWVGWIGITLG